MDDRSLNAVPGVRAGHWTHESGTTGVTAVLFPAGAVGGLAVAGHASGTRELGALDPTHVAGAVHGFCLAGGSAFGLDAAGGVQEVLEARGIGFDTGAGRVPIVPAAILFDLPVAAVRPGREAGRAAAEAALAARGPLAEGRVGAGAGARAGKIGGRPTWGGFGGWAERAGEWTVAAGVAVNPLGCVRDPDTGEWLAGDPGDLGRLAPPPGDWRGATTLVVVATDAPLSRPQCTVVARMAAAGIARAVWPAFTPFDGDTVFCAATGEGAPPDAVAVARIGAAAAACVGRAIARGVRAAAR